MNALDQCERETIAVRTVNGIEQVPAWRYRELAVNIERSDKRPTGKWTITHVPSGLCFPIKFTAAEPACAAMIGISLLRNDWAVFELSAITPKFKDQVRKIYAAHQGEEVKVAKRLATLGEKAYCTDLNGYTPEQEQQP